MKRVTPVIAIVILLLITVALAGTAWSYLSGFLGTQTSKSFEIPSGGGGAFCRSAPCPTGLSGVCNEFIVLVTNTGSDVLKIDDFVIREIDGKTKVPVTIDHDNDAGASTAAISTHNLPTDGLTTGEGGTGLKLTCTAAATSNCADNAGSLTDYLDLPVPGLHTIRIGTSAVTKTIQVSCPG